MTINLRGRDFLKLLDFSTEEINHLLYLARDFKRKKREGIPHRHLEGKNIVLLFQKTSTRTRCSFEVSAFDLGMGATYLDPSCSQMGTKESIEDTARVLDRFYDGIEFRGFKHADVEELAEHAEVPVWNGLTDEWHPTQMLADIMTLQEQFDYDIAGKTLAFMGDCKNNVGRSLMVACAKMGMNFIACGPADCMPGEDVVSACEPLFAEYGTTCTLTQNVEDIVGAHAVYTDVWVSLGEADEVWESRIASLEPYRVTKEVMELADSSAIFLHCLPSFHDTNTVVGSEKARQFGITEMEVTDEVFEGPQSRVFDQAENRMHTIKAVMYATLA